MSFTPTEREEVLDFEITVYDGGEIVHRAAFDSLDEATAFAEDWTERAPGTRYEIEHRSHDHSAWEAVETETALEEDYPSS